ncbi:MAG: YbjQ family protein [Desulfobacteraceae bacterium]|jgi:uncharacterized protein YbjQ (UPF0145 family)
MSETYARSEPLNNTQEKSREFDGPCTLCGKPGYVQALPDVPVSDIRCEDCAQHLGKDILAGFKSMIGGEIEEYTKMMAEAREQAIDRMVANAINLGADGIVGIRFTTSTVLQGAAELVAYGTGVKLEIRAKNIPDK